MFVKDKNLKCNDDVDDEVLNSFLSMYNLKVDQRGLEYQTASEVGQFILDSREIDAKVENIFYRLRTKTVKGNFVLPDNCKNAFDRSTRREGMVDIIRFNSVSEIYWEFLSQFLSIRIIVFEFKENKLTNRSYGGDHSYIINILFMTERYMILEYLKDRYLKLESKNLIYISNKLTHHLTLNLHQTYKKPCQFVKGRINMNFNRSFDYNERFRTSKPHIPMNTQFNRKFKPVKIGKDARSDVILKQDQSNTQMNKNIRITEGASVNKPEVGSKEIITNNLNFVNIAHDDSIVNDSVKNYKKITTYHNNDYMNYNPSAYNDKKQSLFAEAVNFITEYQERYRKTMKPCIESNNKIYNFLTEDSEFKIGRIKFYKHVNKFGLIVIETGEDILMHKNNIVKSKICSEGLDNCNKFFTITVRFKLEEYFNRNITKTKVCDIELVNFLPKKDLFTKNGYSKNIFSKIHKQHL